MKNSFSIRRCALPDLDAIMKLQQHISDTMTNPDLFVATDRADNRDYLISPNAIFPPHRLRLPHFSKRRP